MKRKDIAELITAKMWDREYGNGFGYSPVYLNGERIKYAELKKLAQEGDKVEIEVYSSRGWFYVGTVSFAISYDEGLIESYRSYKRNSLSVRTRDNQRQKVYSWQTFLPRGERLTSQQCNKIAAEIYTDYGFPHKQPEIIVTKAKKSYSTYYRWDHQIRLAAGWGQYRRVVLHELTHALLNTMGLSGKIQPHGKEFVALFTEMCELYLDGDITEAKRRGTHLGTHSQYQGTIDK
jgi:hypothetical protein